MWLPASSRHASTSQVPSSSMNLSPRLVASGAVTEAPSSSQDLPGDFQMISILDLLDVLHITAEKKPKSTDGNLVSCNSIWYVFRFSRQLLIADSVIRTQLQSNPDFQAGRFDLDGLCSELRAKAKCSESGVMVDQVHVNAALAKLGQRDPTTGGISDVPPLVFE